MPPELPVTLPGWEGEELDPAAIYAELGTAAFIIDRETNRLTGWNAAIAVLLGVEQPEPSNDAWWRFFGSSTATENPLNYAIQTGVRSAIPPTVINSCNGEERLVAGLATPLVRADGRQTLVVLRELDNPLISAVREQVLSARDTIAILGVDQLDYGPEWDADRTTCLLVDLRLSLLEIVRSEDFVSLPMGNCIAVVLADIGVEESVDVTNAFLSHLRAVPQHYGVGAKRVRFSVGIARRDSSETDMHTLVSANNAMLHAQQNVNAQHVLLATRWDTQLLYGSNYCSDGIFSGCAYSSKYHVFLEQLSAFHSPGGQPCTSLNNILEHIVRQPAVRCVAIYRLRKDGGAQFMTAGTFCQEAVSIIDESKVIELFPRDIQRLRTEQVSGGACIRMGETTLIKPLVYRNTALAYLAIEYDADEVNPGNRFTPETIAQQLLTSVIPGLKDRADAPELPSGTMVPAASPLETEIEGYVVDNMEGAVDQATFLAKLDIPVAIVGPRGTGKMYIAKIVHQESGGAEGNMVQVDCREFRNREEAVSRIARVLEQSEGKTLVFKSPQLMNPEAQAKLARQISTRTLADVRPPRYLPKAKYVALFPDSLESLVQHSGLSDKLASVFAGYPINVPPVKDRKQAVLRWAHKILGQESAERDRLVKGFTPDAELAMLNHDWLGNISEMRQCIVTALDRTNKEWITPVDLGIFKGITADGSALMTESEPFLSVAEQERTEKTEYISTPLEDLATAMGEAVNLMYQEEIIMPLGLWLEDEIVLAVIGRYQGDHRSSAEFLHTKTRNISRWMPKILSRQDERATNTIWRAPLRCLGEWIRVSPHLSESPMIMLENMLLRHVIEQYRDASVATRAKIMGVSIPTYQKRLIQLSSHLEK